MSERIPETNTSVTTYQVLEDMERTSDITMELFGRAGTPVLPIPEDVYLEEQRRINDPEETGSLDHLINDIKESRVNTWSSIPLRTGNPRDTFKLIQKWEGIVTEKCKDSFFAQLTTLKGEDADLIVEIYNEEVDEGDLALLEPGAMFYWNIGYIKRPSGTIRASLIRFRRLPPWTTRQLEKAKAKSLKLNSIINAN